MVRRTDSGPREWDALNRKFRPKPKTERYQLRSEKGEPRGYASLGSDGIVPESQLPDLSGGSTAAGIALAGGWKLTWTGIDTLALAVDSPDGVARVAVVNTGGLWLSVELTAPVTWSKLAGGAGGLQVGTIPQANTGYEIRLITKNGGLNPALLGTPNGTEPALPTGYTFQSAVLGFASLDDSSDLRPFYQAGDYFWWGYSDPGVTRVGYPLAENQRATVSTAIDLSELVPAAAIEGTFWGYYLNNNATVRSCYLIDAHDVKRFELRAISGNEAYETVNSCAFVFPLFGTPATDLRYRNVPSAPPVGEGLDLDIIGFRLPFAAQSVTLSGTSGAGTVTAVTGSGLVESTGGTTPEISLELSAASKLVGRGSAAGAGAAQAITLGTNLSMSGTTLNATGGGSVSDGDKGDITVSGSGTTWTIDNDVVTYPKMQNVSAESQLLGRGQGAGAGNVEEITLANTLEMSGTFLQVKGGSIEFGTHIEDFTDGTVLGRAVGAGSGPSSLQPIATAGGTAGTIPVSNGSGKLPASFGGAASTLATLDAGALVVEAVKALRETGGPTTLTLGAIADGSLLKRVGATVVGSTGGNADTLDSLDSTAFAILAGQAGGQHLKGGTASGDDLTLESTNHATKGDVILQPGGGAVGLGTTAPNVAATQNAGAGVLTLKGQTLFGAVEMATAQADANGNFVGIVQFSDVNSTSTDKRRAAIAGLLQGTTANKRGGKISFYTVPDNSDTIAERVTIDNAGAVFIGDNANANNLSGLTVNQGAADDEIIALKSSDVAHGMTSVAETDTFGRLAKVAGADGGLLVDGLSEGSYGLYLIGRCTTDTATRSTAGLAPVMLVSQLKSGTTAGNPAADKNVVAMAAGSNTRWILDSDGDTWQGGSATLAEIAAPSTPASGYGVHYVSTAGKPRFINDSGTDYDLTGTGGWVVGLDSDTVAGAAATSVQFTGLTLAIGEMWILHCAIENATGGAITLSLNYNADTTATNYYRQTLNAVNTTISGSRANNPEFVVPSAGDRTNIQIHVARDEEGRTRASIDVSRDDAANILGARVWHIWNSTTNPTSIEIVSATASGIGIGSRFDLYKLAVAA
jgi:hypothetical protein